MDIRTLTAAIVVDFEAVPGANGVVFPTEIGVATLYANKSSYLRLIAKLVARAAA